MFGFKEDRVSYLFLHLNCYSNIFLIEILKKKNLAQTGYVVGKWMNIQTVMDVFL